MNEAVHIVSDYRSGSTLLDQVLGAHSQICSVGELHHLRAYVRQDRALHDPAYPMTCTCGVAIVDCEFWSSVQRSAKVPLDQLILRTDAPAGHADSRHIRGRLRRILGSLYWSPASRFIAPLLVDSSIAHDNERLYAAIHQASGCRYVVDSSKSLLRTALLFKSDNSRNRAILLCRDYRGVVHSKMSRGRGLEESARSWVVRLRNMEKLVTRIPTACVHRVRYEDLCTNPVDEIQKICRFLDLDFQQEMLHRPNIDVHQIGGSPSKLSQERREIRLDTSYRDAFSSQELDAMRGIVGETARSWGYE